MKKRISFYIKLLVLFFIGYILFLVIKTNIVYKNTKMEKIPINSKPYIDMISNFNSESVKINNTYLIDDMDTIITFETVDKSGMLWSISELKNIKTKDILVSTDANIVKRKDGTYKNFTSGLNPLINISYKNERALNDDKQFNLSILPNGRSKYIDTLNSLHNVLHLALNGMFEINNSKGKLLYRVELGYETEIFIFNNKRNLYFLFLQKLHKTAPPS